MRTVPTLCATGAGIPLAVAGLKLALDDDSRFPVPAKRETEMTAVTTCTVSAIDPRVTNLDLRDSRAFSSPTPPRTAASVEDGRRTLSSDTRPNSKRRNLTSKADDHEILQTSFYTNTRPQAWLRRWSSSMSASRDSSSTPTSRPGSAAVSYSNASVAFSHSGSNTPMFLDPSPLTLPPNKLVKRASSTHSPSASPAFGPGSRLPLPIFKRPATSHQRSYTLRDQFRQSTSDQTLTYDQPQDSPNLHWRHYFSPKIDAGERVLGRRRSSTGIPNPIKRVYPQRRHLPVLVSAKEVVLPAQVEMEHDLQWPDVDMADARTTATNASSLPSRAENSTTVNPSFSLGSILSDGPSPLWRRPSSSKGKSMTNKLTKGPRQRIASAPHAPMGSSISTNHESGRPTKRRDTTDPEITRRSIHSSSSNIGDFGPRLPHDFQSGHTPVPRSAHFSAEISPLFGASLDGISSLPVNGRRSPLSMSDVAATRLGRVSATQSEMTSTTGSDSERQSVGGYSTDNQSDTVYDTFPTQRSNSGKRGPPIDTIFDDSPPPFSSGRSTRLRDFLSEGNFPSNERGAAHRHSTIEEEESTVSTPVRSVRDRGIGFTPSARPGAQHFFASSPPAMSIIAGAGADDSDWDAPDMQLESAPVNHGLGTNPTTPSAYNNLHDAKTVLPFRFGSFSRSLNPASTTSTPNRNGSGNVEKANLFDWSEQLPSPNQHNSPPRPRTVHGKKDPENRGSRTTGRRPASGMHARSHSVPVVPDVDGKRPNVIANKFGTWGVGSKAVTEDWNEDFDFDEAQVSVPESITPNGRRIDSAMFVPRSIREQQENVVANIGLLREWGLLIEELKDLRIRAFALDMITGDNPYALAWKEVDAMIDLADQETEEETLEPRQSPPSSPGFDFSAFEEPPGLVTGETDDIGKSRGPLLRIASPHLEDEERQIATATNIQNPSPNTITTRPRKDSEAVARSVIEALQSKRTVSQSNAMHSSSTTKKLPFDTATLRHIVPYVNSLKRKVKDGLREKEGLYSSPRRRLLSDENDDEMHDDENEQPAFRSIFNDPGMGSPVNERRTRRQMAVTDHDGSTEHFKKQSSDLADRIHMMSLPS